MANPPVGSSGGAFAFPVPKASPLLDLATQAASQLAPTSTPTAAPAQPTPAAQSSSDPNAAFPLPEFPSAKGFSESGGLQILRTGGGAGRPQFTVGNPDYTVQGGEAGFRKELDNYFIVRQRRINNLADKLDADTGKALRDALAQKIAAVQASQQFQAADPTTQAQMLDSAYAETEAQAISAGAVTADGKGESDDGSKPTSLGYTPQDLAALQAVASKYLLPFVQQAAASGGMAQATMNQIASQAATPQMRLYATAMGNAQKAGQDQIAAAYMQQVSAAPTMQVIAANTDLAQQNAQLQQQLLYYKTMQQQGQSAPSTDLFAQAQAAMSGAGTGG